MTAARQVVGISILVMCLATITLGHHSQTQFDLNQTVTLEGTLTEIRWTNPHAFFYLDGRISDGKNASLQSWGIEGPGPRGLENVGWSRDTAKVGDRVVVTGHPRKDGKAQLIVLSITLPDGKKIAIRPE